MIHQRQPRKPDPGYLTWLRTQRCACGCLKGPPCDAAHLRASSVEHGKDFTGMGRKPDDRWALPLLHAHHMSQHDYGDELGWWRAHGIADPFELCKYYYRRYQRSKSK
jgi:hypothetical protein